MNKNDIVEITITDLTIEGKGVGRYNNQVIFVSGAAIYDRLSVKIIKICKNYSVGKIEEIIKASPYRRDIDCEYYPKCGGCAFRHISYESELKIKSKYVSDCISKIGRIEGIKVNPIIGALNTDRYRNKMQIPVRYDKYGNINVGFYSLHSHRVVNCEDCKLNPYIFIEIVKAIKNWMNSYNITAYNDELGTGTVRNIYIRQANLTKDIMVCLVVNEKKLKFIDKLIDCLVNKYKNIRSIVINFNTKETNVILGKDNKIIWGNKYIEDELCGVKLKISPNSFYQVNHSQTEILYKIVAQLLNLNGDENVLDLYCGIGSIGLSIAKYISKLIGVEVVEDAVRNARQNAIRNSIKNAKFVCNDSINIVNKAIDSVDFNPDIIVLDPPRKGCPKEVIEHLSKINPKKIVYISCNPSTLARDLQEFRKNNFRITKIVPVDLFPRTGHVETIALLTSELLNP